MNIYPNYVGQVEIRHTNIIGVTDVKEDEILSFLLEGTEQKMLLFLICLRPFSRSHWLYSLSLNQGHKLEEVGDWDGSVWRWSLNWRRARFEWETSLEAELDGLISRAKVRTAEKDALEWRCEVNGCFTVSSAYDYLVRVTRGPQINVFNHLWKTKTFPNVIFTAWRVLLNKIPTRMCLRRRGIPLDTYVCALCELKEESCQHLFLECKVASRV